MDKLFVYTDASADALRGSIAFSVWDANRACLGRFSSVTEEYNDANTLELIGIRTALSWVREHYPEVKVKLVIDSDSAKRYIRNTELNKEPYRSIADDIISMNIISSLTCIKSHTSIKGMDYRRNMDVDELAREARLHGRADDGLISHSTFVDLVWRPSVLKDDDDILKPVDARTLVKNYYKEKEVKPEVPHIVKSAIVSGVKPEMSQTEKFAARFNRFKK